MLNAVFNVHYCTLVFAKEEEYKVTFTDEAVENVVTTDYIRV